MEMDIFKLMEINIILLYMQKITTIFIKKGVKKIHFFLEIIIRNTIEREDHENVMGYFLLIGVMIIIIIKIL